MTSEPGPPDTSTASIVYLNGAFMPAGEARISPFDRGFLFAHAAYEVTAVYGSHMIDWPGHAARLERTLAGIDIPMPMDLPVLEDVHKSLIERNTLKEGLVYLQVTAGANDARDFAGPDKLTPAMFLFTTSKPLIAGPARDGIHAISLPDTRWQRRDLKTTQLLSQALAYRSAKAAGASVAIMHEDGVVTEAASANAWIVTADGTLVTRDLSSSILSGITRSRSLDLLKADTTVEQRPFSLAEAASASEMFTTSAGALIVPVVRLDGNPIGTGLPGPVTRRVQRRYYEAMGVDVPRLAPWAFD